MKYGPEMTQEIVQHIKDGRTQRDAATLAGISEGRFYEWMKKEEFSEAVKKAQATFKKEMEVHIKKAAINTWQAAAWMLERRFKNDYALRQEVTGESGKAIFENLNDEQLVSRINKVLANGSKDRAGTVTK